MKRAPAKPSHSATMGKAKARTAANSSKVKSTNSSTTAKTTERILELRRQGGRGSGFHAIARKLNEEGFRTDRGSAWHRPTVRAIVLRAGK